MSPWTWESYTHVFLLRSNLLNCWYNLLTTIKFADLLTKFADDNLICWQQKFADKICWHFDFAYRICWQTEKFADKERPCRLGWINKIAKTVASRQSEDGWRQRSSMSQITAGTCLGRTFQELIPGAMAYRQLMEKRYSEYEYQYYRRTVLDCSSQDTNPS
jgi:hypothetical protein